MSWGFTPGPWALVGGIVTAPDTDPHGSADEPWQIAIVQGCVGYGCDQSKANANLIAAAPDLYAQMVRAVDLLDRVSSQDFQNCARVSREVLARATITSPIDARIEGEER